jgi:hypothetical protein
MCGDDDDDDDVLCVWMSKALNVNSFILEANQTTWSNPGFCCLVQSGKYMLESQVKNVQAPR